MVELRIHVGDERVVNMRADGVIVSTPRAPLPYALGRRAILQPQHCRLGAGAHRPHTLTNRPIVLPDAGPVRMEIVAGRDTSVSFDVQRLASLLVGDSEDRRCGAARIGQVCTPGAGLLRHAAQKLRWYEG